MTGQPLKFPLEVSTQINLVRVSNIMGPLHESVTTSEASKFTFTLEGLNCIESVNRLVNTTVLDIEFTN